MLHLTLESARKMILDGRAPEEDFFIEGDLDLSNTENLYTLPDTCRGAWGLNVESCNSLTHLPANLDVKRLNISDCDALTTLPDGLVSYEIIAQRCGLQKIPDGIQVDYRLDLTNCRDLQRLPDHFEVGSLIVSGCTSLTVLPDDLSLYFLDASGCINLTGWGATGHVEIGNINLNGCGLLTYLPDWMGRIARLDIGGCANLEQLPDTLQITSTIEIAGSGLKNLPVASDGVTIRWRDVQIDERIAFRPHDIDARDVLSEKNIERRRVMLERIGYDHFFEQVNAEELDRDTDPGGVRTLLRVTFEDTNRWRQDEPLVCLRMSCPSTARKYVVRVPPIMETCHQAAAWIAGFDDPALYNPVIET